MTLPGESESEDHPLAIAVWADGTLISSAAGDGAYGQPYRTANIGAEASETIHSRIRAVMLEREGKLGSFRIPDASSEELLVRDGDRVWRMQSCIDIFEANTSVVAFPGGIAARDQAPPRDANDPEERELREFREAWSRAKKLLLSAVPVAGDPLEAQDLKFRAIGSTPR